MWPDDDRGTPLQRRILIDFRRLVAVWEDTDVYRRFSGRRDVWRHRLRRLVGRNTQSRFRIGSKITPVRLRTCPEQFPTRTHTHGVDETNCRFVEKILHRDRGGVFPPDFPQHLTRTWTRQKKASGCVFTRKGRGRSFEGVVTYQNGGDWDRGIVQSYNYFVMPTVLRSNLLQKCWTGNSPTNTHTERRRRETYVGQSQTPVS